MAASNLFFLPVAGKLKIRIHEEAVLNEIALEGVMSILAGMNNRMLETKLNGFLPEVKGETGASGAAPAAAPEAAK